MKCSHHLSTILPKELKKEIANVSKSFATLNIPPYDPAKPTLLPKEWPATEEDKQSNSTSSPVVSHLIHAYFL